MCLNVDLDVVLDFGFGLRGLIWMCIWMLGLSLYLDVGLDSDLRLCLNLDSRVGYGFGF